MKPKLFTWGLAQDDFKAVSTRIGGVDAQDLPNVPSKAPNGILLIDAGSLPGFVAWVHDREHISDERPYPVLLFLPAGKREPIDLWSYYDDVVDINNLEALEQMIKHPGIVEAELAAADVPVTFLRSLTRPVSAIPIAQYPFGSEQWDQPDSEIRRLLAEDATCRMAFNAALEWHMSMVAGGLDTTWEICLGVVIDRLQMQDRQRQNQRTAAILVLAAFQQQVHDISVRRRAAQTDLQRSRIRGSEEDDITEMLQPLLQAATETEGTETSDMSSLVEEITAGLVLDSHKVEFHLQLTNDELIFDKLTDPKARPIDDYRIEIRRNEQAIWNARSRNGRVALPLPDLERSLNDGPIQFMILQHPQEA